MFFFICKIVLKFAYTTINLFVIYCLLIYISCMCDSKLIRIVERRSLQLCPVIASLLTT